MKPKPFRSQEAENDLVDIWLYIAEDSEKSADRLIDKIDEVCQMLAESPMAGKNRSEVLPRLRSFPVGNYVIFYEPRDGGITVVRVVHGARDVKELFGSEN